MKEIKDYEIARFEAGEGGEDGEIINGGRDKLQCRLCNDSVDDVPSLLSLMGGNITTAVI